MKSLVFFTIIIALCIPYALGASFYYYDDFNFYQNYTLPKLPYALNALEPYITEKIMSLHYLEHHQAYVNNLNRCLKELNQLRERQSLLLDAIKGSESEDHPTQANLHSSDISFTRIDELIELIRFSFGGYVNHCFFWLLLIPPQNYSPLSEGGLLDAINRDFGSLDEMLGAFKKRAMALQGSGWAWLVVDRSSKHLKVIITLNQGLVDTNQYVPLFGIDMWEHAYYLQYYNQKGKFIDAFYNIIHWGFVEKIFESTLQ